MADLSTRLENGTLRSYQCFVDRINRNDVLLQHDNVVDRLLRVLESWNVRNCDELVG
jgi:hypothetical protein